MGSCYSSTYKSTASTSVEVNVKGCDSAVKTVTQEQRSSGRWKRRKGWGSDGNGFGGEIDIPGRMCSNGSSEVACLYTQQGKKGTNQDAMLVWENFNSRSDTTFCGVFDGHGPFGHMVAKKVRDSLPIILCTQWKANYNNDPNNLCTNQNANGSTNCEESSSPSIDDEWCESLENEQNGKIPEMYQPLKVSMLKAFKLMDKELKLHPTIDCFCSGSTAVTLIKQGQDLIIGNVGDSRAVLATRDKDNSLVSVQLTVDLKPDLPGEAARIQQCKGRVFALQDEPEVVRVWLPTSDSPGLAMARAFGDFCLKDFGLISIPDVYHHRIAEKDEFVILATDGVWDVLSNTEAVDIVASAPSRTTAARALVDCATRSWRLKYPTSKNDDCAVVCLFLDHQFDAAMNVKGNDSTTVHVEAMEMIEIINENADVTEEVGSHAVLEHSGTVRSQEVVESHSVLEESGTIFSSEVVESHAVLEDSGTLRSSDEIVPVSESTEEKIPMKSQSRRTLAECISNAEEEEWSALEGVTRVNSLLSLPRFLSGDKRTASWRKWL